MIATLIVIIIDTNMEEAGKHVARGRQVTGGAVTLEQAADKEPSDELPKFQRVTNLLEGGETL